MDHERVIEIPKASEEERGMVIMTLTSGQIVVRGVIRNSLATLAGAKLLMVITKINDVVEPGQWTYRWKRVLKQNEHVVLTISGKAKLDPPGASGALTTTSVAAGRVAFKGTKTDNGAPDALKSPSLPTAPDYFSHAAAAPAPL